MAKKRSKPEVDVTKVTSLSEADALLHRIADLRAALRKEEADADIAVNEIKERLKASCQPLLDEINALEKSLAVYSEYNKEELFKDKKTIELTFGLFGFRQSTAISVRKSTLEKIKEHCLTEAIRIKETPNKDIMAEWSEEKLALVDARRVVKDQFWIETKENDVEVPA